MQHEFRLKNKYYKPNNSLTQSTLAGYYFYLLLGCVIIMEKIVNAANVRKISWTNNTLRFYFDNGQIVAYKDVPEGIYAGLCTAASIGSYARLYIYKNYTYEVEQLSDLKSQNLKLEHHKDTSVGLWATDRPDLIPKEIKDLFFEITFESREVAC